MKRIGIIGAGKLGITLAQLGIKAGYEVYISGSGSPEMIKLTVDSLAPGAKAVSSEDVAEKCEVIILALPLKNFTKIPLAKLKNKLIIDAMNYWWETDGTDESKIHKNSSSSEFVQKTLSDSIVVKSFSHMGYHHLHDDSILNRNDTITRKSLAIAGDDSEANEKVAEVVSDFGFEPLIIRSLAEGKKLEPGGKVFGANVSALELENLIV